MRFFIFSWLLETDARTWLLFKQTLKPGGTVIISTFALDGPPKCSGLEVTRYDEKTMVAELGEEFKLHELRYERHLTPWGSEQRFIYFRFQRQAS